MKEFYVHDGQSQNGPYSLEQLKLLNLSKETLIWYEGLEKWTSAGSVSEISSLFVSKQVPPPLVKTINDSLAGTYIPVTAQETTDSSFKATKKSFLIPILTFGLVAATIIIWLIYQSKSNAETISSLQSEVTTQQVEKLQKDNEEKGINEAIEKRNFNYRNNWEKYIAPGHDLPQIDYALGGISSFNVYITNETDCMIDQVDVLVDYIRKSGESWQPKVISFFNIAPHSTETRIAPSSINGIKEKVTVQKIISKKMQFCFPLGGGKSLDPYFCD
jgi:hypothetical protein